MSTVSSPDKTTISKDFLDTALKAYSLMSTAKRLTELYDEKKKSVPNMFTAHRGGMKQFKLPQAFN